MHRSSTTLRASAAAAALLLAACATPDSVTAPSATIRFPGSVARNIELPPTEPQGVTVCKIGPAGSTATFSVEATGGGTFPMGTAFTLNASPDSVGNCALVWKAIEKDGLAWFVTVTETGSSANTVLEIVTKDDYFGVVTYSAPVNSAEVITNYDHPASITFTNVAVEPPPPPPPPTVCGGLTPGYWKNWRNHYTAAQFASLLPGTIASSIANADNIFAAKGSKSIEKLRWFVLANQLTLNLTQTTLPNPSSGSLTGTCSATVGSPALGSTLAIALDILNGVGGPYSNSYILSIKDLLDAIANMVY